jgi:hypothetical protein
LVMYLIYILRPTSTSTSAPPPPVKAVKQTECQDTWGPCEPVDPSDECSMDGVRRRCDTSESCVYTPEFPWEPLNDGVCEGECGVGTRYHVRLACGRTEITEEPCDTGVQCDKPCQLTEWVGGECSKTCGTGERRFTRTVISEAEGSSTPCSEYELQRTDACNTDTCPPCEYAPLEKSECVSDLGCGMGQRAFRAVSTEDCVRDDARLLQPCDTGVNCDANCRTTEWETDGLCSRECGGGMLRYTRTILEQGRGQGARCDWGTVGDVETSLEPCNQDPCPPCEYVPDGGCEGECGVGVMAYRRSGSGECVENEALLSQPCETGVSCDADCTPLVPPRHPNRPR